MTGLSVRNALEKVGLSRLAHFTPALNLPHILGDKQIRSSKDLAANSSDYFSPTDIERFDRNPDKICCSFEYPNPYYLDVAKGKSQFTNYPDWVCLLLDRDLVLRPGALFSPRNAAAGGGTYARAGGNALLACFAGGTGWMSRRPSHHPGAATDLQAEALIPGPVSLSYLRGIVVPSEEAARNEWGRLSLLGLQDIECPWLVAPTFFKKQKLSQILRFGGEIKESIWQAP